MLRSPPFTLIFAVAIAVRAALVLPIEPRANWVFRMTEDPVREPSSSARFSTPSPAWRGAGPVLLPVQWSLFGSRALSRVVTSLAGIVFVELHMGDWPRIPFTCSYIPGKRFVGNTILIGFVSFVAFTFFGWAFALYGFRRPIGGLVVMAILGVVAMQRRRHRLWLWRGPRSSSKTFCRPRSSR